MYNPYFKPLDMPQYITLLGWPAQRSMCVDDRRIMHGCTTKHKQAGYMLAPGKALQQTLWQGTSHKHSCLKAVLRFMV